MTVKHSTAIIWIGVRESVAILAAKTRFAGAGTNVAERLESFLGHRARTERIDTDYTMRSDIFSPQLKARFHLRMQALKLKSLHAVSFSTTIIRLTSHLITILNHGSTDPLSSRKCSQQLPHRSRWRIAPFGEPFFNEAHPH